MFVPGIGQQLAATAPSDISDSVPCNRVLMKFKEIILLTFIYIITISWRRNSENLMYSDRTRQNVIYSLNSCGRLNFHAYITSVPILIRILNIANIIIKLSKNLLQSCSPSYTNEMLVECL